MGELECPGQNVLGLVLCFRHCGMNTLLEGTRERKRLRSGDECRGCCLGKPIPVDYHAHHISWKECQAWKGGLEVATQLTRVSKPA